MDHNNLCLDGTASVPVSASSPSEECEPVLWDLHSVSVVERTPGTDKKTRNMLVLYFACFLFKIPHFCVAKYLN